MTKCVANEKRSALYRNVYDISHSRAPAAPSGRIGPVATFLTLHHRLLVISVMIVPERFSLRACARRRFLLLLRVFRANRLLDRLGLGSNAIGDLLSSLQLRPS